MAARPANLRCLIIFIGTFFLFCLFLWLRRKAGLRRNSNSVMPTFRCRVFRLEGWLRFMVGRETGKARPVFQLSAKRFMKVVPTRSRSPLGTLIMSEYHDPAPG